MAKTRKDRPGLVAWDVLRGIRDKKIRVSWLRPKVPIAIVLVGFRITQHWLKRDKTKQRNAHFMRGRTYVRKGIIIAPIWKPVALWEMTYLQENGLDPKEFGVTMIEGKAYRLIYMQVEDLSHIHRQIGHAIDNYQKFFKPTDGLTPEEQNLIRIGNIVDTLEFRQFNIDGFFHTFLSNLRKHHDTIKRLIEDLENGAVVSFEGKIDSVIEFCRAIKHKPMYRKLYHSGNSLELAANYLSNGNISRTKACLRSALRNLEYPKIS